MSRGASPLVLALLLTSGCGGEPTPSALGEPIHVRNGYFKEGALPGTAPLADGEVPPEGATYVTLVESANNVVRPGQAGKGASGRATASAGSVAVRLDDLGTGYWIVPTDVPDPAAAGELTWGMAIDFSREVAPGLHQLRFAAIDDAGGSGPVRPLNICVTSPVPDNLNACDRTIPPPAAVFSLAWDTDVDLDLVLVAPNGKIVDAKHPTTAAPTDAGVAPDAGDGALDRDSNASCVLDGVRRENVVFQEKPEPGLYLVYASLFSACGLPSTRFTASFYQPEPTGVPGEQALVEKLSKNGELLAIDESGGSTLGLFVMEIGIQ